MRIVSAAAMLALAALSWLPASFGAATRGATLVELAPDARCTEAVYLVSSGATPVAPSLGLYSLRADAAARIVPLLHSRNAIRLTTPDRRAGSLAVRDFTDPLVPSEWWRTAIGVDTLTPPGVGKAVTIVDSGIDVSHPEFLGRVNTETMNAQEPAPIGGEHGTSVASIVAAPENGLGLVGVYPEALFRSWDAAKGQGTALQTSEIVQGILAAANDGPGVVNLSLGSEQKELVIEQAIYEAVRKGTLVVAASGNSGDEGNPLGYPASIPHVLTVGASDQSNGVAAFSSRSRFVDLVAPGVDIPVATAIGNGWRTGDGTSFAAPIVSGASAWVWTVRPELDASQLFDVMRKSAIDVVPPGRDDAAGYGVLNVPAALAYPAPPADSAEPNDDVSFVRPGGLYDNGIPPLTTAASRVATTTGRVDRAEDPRDVYRIWLPRNGRITAAIVADANLDLSLWKPGTVSVTGRPGKDRLALAAPRGLSKRLTFTNADMGRFGYLAVTFPPGPRDATYRLRIS